MLGTAYGITVDRGRVSRNSGPIARWNLPDLCGRPLSEIASKETGRDSARTVYIVVAAGAVTEADVRSRKTKKQLWEQTGRVSLVTFSLFLTQEPNTHQTDT